MTRIAATGTTGTIGRHLDAMPLQSRLAATVDHKHRELATLPQVPQVIIHLAGRSDVGACEAAPDEAWRDNVEGSLTWLQAAGRAGVRRFVFASSAHVFQPTATPVLNTPWTPVDTTTVYGRTKVAAEQELVTLGRRLGVEVSVVRIFSVFALDMSPHYLGAALVRRARTRDFSPLRGHQHTRDFTAASTVGAILERHANALAAERVAVTAHPLHLCSGRMLQVGELARRVFAHLGVAIPDDAPLLQPDAEPPNFLLGAPSAELLALCRTNPPPGSELL